MNTATPRIALDAAAGDFGTIPNIDGALRAAAAGIEVVMVGPQDEIRKRLEQRGVGPADPRFSIVDAPQVISMSEEPAAACRAKPRNSIMVCAELAAAGKVSGVVSAGNSGAVMVAGLWHLKRIPGILRPAIAVVLPTPRGPTLLLDAGANVDCKAWHLLQFAAMGEVYAKHVLQIEKPRIGLLSIGEENSKGNELVKEAFPLLECSGLEFAGMIEGRDIPAGKTDVVVCDGFVGNIVVKLMEGASAAMATLIRTEIESKPWYKAAAAVLHAPFAAVKKRLSYDEYGGAPLLGVNGDVVVCHGRSNSKAIAKAIKVAAELSRYSVRNRIQESVEHLKQNLQAVKI